MALTAALVYGIRFVRDRSRESADKTDVIARGGTSAFPAANLSDALSPDVLSSEMLGRTARVTCDCVRVIPVLVKIQIDPPQKPDHVVCCFNRISGSAEHIAKERKEAEVNTQIINKSAS